DRPQALDGRLHVPIGDEIPCLVVLSVSLEQVRIGQEADKDEDAPDRQVLLEATLHVADIPHFAVALDLTYLGVHDELDFRVGPRALLEDRLSAELTPAVDDVDLRGVARQEVALLQRRVASADNRQLLALEEGAITNGAVRDATPGELCLSG